MQTLIQTLTLLTLLWVSWVDLKTKRIPETSLFILFFLGGLWILENNLSFLIQGSMAILSALLFWGLGFCISRIKQTAALGLGDVKLWAALSFFLPLNALPLLIVSTGLIGFIIAFFFYPKKETIPFAPALSLGFLTAFLC